MRYLNIALRTHTSKIKLLKCLVLLNQAGCIVTDSRRLAPIPEIPAGNHILLNVAKYYKWNNDYLNRTIEEFESAHKIAGLRKRDQKLEKQNSFNIDE